MKEIVARMGTFLVMIGLGMLFLFVLSDLAEQPDFDYLFVAVLLIGVGRLFQRRRAPPTSAGRFSLLRRGRRGGDRGAEAVSQANPEKK